MTSRNRPRAPLGRLLVVDDEELSRRALQRLLSRYRALRVADSVDAALVELRARKDWCGFAFDVSLGSSPEGGLDLLSLVHADFPGVPAAIITGHISPRIVNRAAALGATVLSKPLGEVELLPFLQRVTSCEHGFAQDFSERLGAVTRGWRLSPREHEALAWFVSGGTRESYIASTGIAETTLKTHVRHMLAKTGTGSIAELVTVALRRVFLADQPGEPSRPLLRRRTERDQST